MNDILKKQKLLQSGAELAGAAIGGVIGLVGGPVGSVGGGMAGVIISKGLIEFSDRFLSNREQARVGAAASLSITGIQHRIKNGHQLRQDDFFVEDEVYRSKAEELFEGILMKCKNEYEEKKIKYISKIYENVAFDNTVKAEDANQILNVVQRLSYRQLIILSLVANNKENLYNLREKSYEDMTNLTTELQFILRDFAVLINEGLINSEEGFLIIDNKYITPGKMILSEVGKQYFKLLNLVEMPVEEFTFTSLLT